MGKKFSSSKISLIKKWPVVLSNTLWVNVKTTKTHININYTSKNSSLALLYYHEYSNFLNIDLKIFFFARKIESSKPLSQYAPRTNKIQIYINYISKFSSQRDLSIYVHSFLLGDHFIKINFSLNQSNHSLPYQIPALTTRPNVLKIKMIYQTYFLW